MYRYIVLNSVSKVMALSFVIRVVASYRGMLYIAGKLLKFPVRRCKFPGVDLRDINLSAQLTQRWKTLYIAASELGWVNHDVLVVMVISNHLVVI